MNDIDMDSTTWAVKYPGMATAWWDQGVGWID